MAEKIPPRRIAVVLLNLGGPSEEAAIQPFLFNFFMDENIISAPQPFRYFIAKWISWSRSRGAAKRAYQHLGGKSPLLENTRAQALALEESLRGEGREARVFVSMRYWHPRAEQNVREVIAFQPDKIILLPLYPQYSVTTTFSALQNWHEAAKKAGLNVPMLQIKEYPVNKGLIAASAELIRGELDKAPQKTRLLFSAHGLPEKIIRQGDPYQKHCEQTVAAIVQSLNIPHLDWQICYQSRVGNLKWIGPSTDTALQKAADDQVSVIIYPVAFVSEHVETLVEIDIDYRARAHGMGIPYFAKVPTVGVHPEFISGLKDLVLSQLSSKEQK